MPGAANLSDVVLKQLLRFVPVHRDARILDAGCGSGKYGEALVRSGYHRVVGVDLARSADLRAERAFRFLLADISRLPFRDASFDFIYAISVIYFTPDPARAIAEFKRVLRPGGAVFLTGHTRYSLFTLHRVLHRACGHASVDHLRHVRFRSTTYYRRALEAAGFRVTLQDGYRVFRGSGRLGSLLSSAGLSWPRPLAKGAQRFRSHFAYHWMLAAQLP